MRLERQVEYFLRAKLMLEFMGGASISRIEIAAAKLEAQCQIGVLEPLKVFEVCKCCGWRKLVVHENP